MTDISTLFSAIGGSAVLGGGASAAFIAFYKDAISARIQNSIRNEYDSKLETLKAQLKAESDIQLEKQKHELQMVAVEHQLKFQKLQEKRADIIAETHDKLNGLYASLQEFADGKPIYDEQQRLTKDVTNFAIELGKFKTKLRADKLYFPPNLVMALEGMSDSMWEGITHDYLATALGDSEDTRRKDLRKQINSIEIGMEVLANEMRKLLGVETSKENPP